jgi:hypothetical protein
VVFEWFGLKITRTISAGLVSKPAAAVFAGLASKLVTMVFSSLTSKLVVTVSPGLTSKPIVGFLVEPQNQGGGGFSDLGLKTSGFNLVIWALKSPRWYFGLGSKKKWASVIGCATKPTEGCRRGTRVKI